MSRVQFAPSVIPFLIAYFAPVVLRKLRELREGSRGLQEGFFMRLCKRGFLCGRILTSPKCIPAS